LDVQANSITISAPIARASAGRGFRLSSYRFARNNPFDSGGFTDSRASADLECFRRLTSLDELVEQAAADAVRGAKIVDGLRLHLGSFLGKQKIPALTNQGRGRVSVLQS
jgi:hypothetical protein